jgi:hypothetical protein
MRRRRPAKETARPGRIYEHALVELKSSGTSYFDAGSVVIDEIGNIYAVRDVAVPDSEDRSANHDRIDNEAFNGGTFSGEGSDWGGKATLTRLDPLLPAGSHAICSQDLLHRSASSRNHPNPFTSATQIQFGLPRASSIGLAIYEDTALVAGLLNWPGSFPGSDS